MKRLKRVFLPAVLVLCMVLCMFPITVNAEELSPMLDETPVEGERNWTYVATLSEEDQAKGFYLLIVFRKSAIQVDDSGNPIIPTLSADDIIYIDQISLETAGKVAFSGWSPSSYTGGGAWIIGTGTGTDFIGWLASHGLLGDVSGDDKVTTKDAVLLMRYLAKMEVFTATQIEMADTKTDGKIATNDAVYILQRLANMRDENYQEKTS